jgi:hypothetical protein
MRKYILSLLVAIIIGSSSVHAQEVQAEAGRQFMQITTIESVVNGGLGRSRMLITNPDGSQKESDMNNLFSIAGINFKNIKENEDKIVKTLKEYTEEGWKVDNITSFTLSPGETSFGIFMTRYLLSKPLKK